MYELRKNGETLYRVEEKPTKLQLEKMDCDECVPFEKIPIKPSNQEIGDKILATVFDGNPYAQLADLTKSQVTTLALLIPILGKETIKTAYGPLIETLRKVSDARVAENLEPFDISFLD